MRDSYLSKGSEPVVWRWGIKAGLIAASVCLVSAEGVTIGATRECMTSFGFGDIIEWTLLFNMFGVSAIMTLLSGAPAFIIAAIPKFPRLPTLIPTLTAGVVLSIGYLFGTLKSTSGFVLVFAFSLVLAGALVGYWIRTVAGIRRMWPAFGILLAVLLGVVIFSTGHYGPIPCAP